MSRHGKSYLKGLLYGSLIGVGLALIYSPRKGEQSQALLRETAAETKQRAEEFTRQINNQAIEWGKLGEDLFSEGRVFVEKIIDRLQDRLRSSTQDIQ
jgi:gas vesicle protein